MKETVDLSCWPPLARGRRTLVCLLLAASGVLALGPGASLGHGYQAGDLKIEHPWARVTAPGVTVGAGYVVIVNAGQPDVLLAASTPGAERVEIHETRLEGGVMRMRRVERLELPAGATVRLEPGGMHMMLIGLRQPLADGAKLPLVLRFAGAGEVRVELKIQAAER